jgi:hypothetical protein
MPSDEPDIGQDDNDLKKGVWGCVVIVAMVLGAVLIVREFLYLMLERG